MKSQIVNYCAVLYFMYWTFLNCTEYLYVIINCLISPIEMAGASDRHQFTNNETSSDTEDYATDDRRRRVFKSRMRYL